jgi:hypothetical protein
MADYENGIRNRKARIPGGGRSGWMSEIGLMEGSLHGVNGNRD